MSLITFVLGVDLLAFARVPFLPLPEKMIQLTNVLYLTNFTDGSNAAIPLLRSLHRGYGAKVHTLHVMLPDLRATVDETSARHGMEGISPLLGGVAHELLLERAEGLWEAVERMIQDRKINLLVLGRRNAGGADEVYERSPIPILTAGSRLTNRADDEWSLRRVLFATDFTPDATNAISHAVALSKKYGAKLILLHVVAQPKPEKQYGPFRMSIAEVMHHLYESIPTDVHYRVRPEVVAEFGKPSERIVHVATARDVDLIVMGTRRTQGNALDRTHSGRNTALDVTLQSPIPVLTVRAGADVTHSPSFDRACSDG